VIYNLVLQLDNQRLMFDKAWSCQKVLPEYARVGRGMIQALLNYK